MLRTFSDNPTCKHIVFGGCHDSGYLLNLEHIKHNIAKASRITLLETIPPHRGFLELINFKRAQFENIFRSEPLPEPAPPMGFPVHSPVQASVQPSVSRTTTLKSSPTPKPRQPASIPSPSVTPAPTESSEDSSWASISKAGVPDKGAITITPSSSTKTDNKNKKWAYYNGDGERLDLPLPPKDPGAAAMLEARMKKSEKKKMCNQW